MSSAGKHDRNPTNDRATVLSKCAHLSRHRHTVNTHDSETCSASCQSANRCLYAGLCNVPPASSWSAERVSPLSWLALQYWSDGPRLTMIGGRLQIDDCAV